MLLPFILNGGSENSHIWFVKNDQESEMKCCDNTQPDGGYWSQLHNRIFGFSVRGFNQNLVRKVYL